MALVLAYLPFNVAIGVAVLLGRGSQSFGDIVGVTIASGAAMGMAGSWLIALARRGLRADRAPGLRDEVR